MEAHIEEPEDKDEPTEQATPAASPKNTVDPVPESSPTAHSPGLGSGTKEDEVQVTGTRHVPVQNAPETLAKVPAQMLTRQLLARTRTRLPPQTHRLWTPCLFQHFATNIFLA